MQLIERCERLLFSANGLFSAIEDFKARFKPGGIEYHVEVEAWSVQEVPGDGFIS